MESRIRPLTVFLNLGGLLLFFLLTPPTLAGEVDWLDDSATQIVSQYDGRSILLIGELHGSRETPAMTSAVVRHLSAKAPVTVALEIPIQEQVRVDRFLASDGSSEAVSDLLEGDFWQVAPEDSDGRRSAAMLELIESLRHGSANAHPTNVVLLDDNEVSGNADDRRQSMADRIAGLADRLESGPVVVLIGNYHARLAPNPGVMMADGKPIEPPAPTASLVKNVPLTSVNVSACEGEIWACFGKPCGRVTLANQCAERTEATLIELDPERDGYHLGLMLPQHSASVPAISP